MIVTITRIIAPLATITLLSACGGGGSSSGNPPVAKPIEVTTTVNTTVTGFLEASDPDGDPLTFGIRLNANLGTVTLADASTGEFSYTPSSDITGTDSFKFAASDGVNTSGLAVATIHILAPAPDAYAAEEDAYSINEGAALDVAANNGVLANDIHAEAKPLTAFLVTGPSHASNFTLNTDGSFSYLHDGGETITDSFIYRASDGTTASNPVTVSITITTVNDAPIAEDDSYGGVNEGATLNVSAASGVLANDTDAEASPLSAKLVTNVAHGNLTLNSDGSFSYTHDGSKNFQDSFIYKANDGIQDSNAATVMLVITPVNHDGAININTAIVPGDILTISVTDPDLNNSASTAETVSVSVVNDTTGETENLPLTETGVNTGVFTNSLPTVLGTTPGPNNNGSLTTQIGNTISATYRDLHTSGGGAANVTANCNAVSGTPPVSASDNFSARRNTQSNALDVLNNDSDPNNTGLTIISVTAPNQNGAVQIINGQSLSYTPANGFLGLETFSYTARNGANRTATDQVTVTVIPEITPNIVYILADDLGYQDLGIYGSPNISTPNLDGMANDGIRFTDFYGATTCGPYRAGLMTGSYAARVGMAFSCTPGTQTSVAVGLNPNEVTIPEILRDRGYTTKMIGKWHLGDHPQFLPMKHGFQSFYGLPYSNDMWPFHPLTCPSANEDPRLTAARARVAITGCEGCGESFCFPVGRFPDLPLYSNEKIIEVNPEQSSLISKFTQQALQFIEQNKNGPFFLYLPFTAPHVPLAPSAQFLGKSPRGLYGDVVQELDWNVGQILNKLKQLGIDQNTLVVFTSDNGPWRAYGIDGGSTGPLRDGKGSQFEGGVRTPMIMRWPGYIPAGTVSTKVAHHADILPTLASLAGGAPPADRVIDGVNIWPVMAGQQTITPHEYVMYYRDDTDLKGKDQTKAFEAIRWGKWKLFITLNNLIVSASALYNLETDPGETTNVMSQNPAVVQQMVAIAQQFNDQMRDNSRPLGVVDISLPQLYGSTHVPATSSVTLSANTPLDWAHWGLSSASRFNRKSGVAQPVTDVTILGSSPVNVYNSAIDVSRGTYSWSGGTPAASATNTSGYIYIRGGQNGNGFEFSLPAGTTQKTVRIYLGVDRAKGKLEASLSDNSSPSFVTFIDNPDRVDNRMAIINVKAASNGAVLTIRYTVADNYAARNGSAGAISLSAVTVGTN